MRSRLATPSRVASATRNLPLFGSFRAFGFTRANEVSTRSPAGFHGGRIVEFPCFSKFCPHTGRVLIDRIVVRWGRMGAPPVSRAAIDAFEHRVAPVPLIMKTLLSKANGMKPNVMDVELMRFWPIEEWLGE